MMPLVHISRAVRGLDRGPPAPMLFNFVADCLTRMILKAQQNNLIVGLMDNLFPKGIAILQYADDTITCLKDDLKKLEI
jgi:hypothetical protein